MPECRAGGRLRPGECGFILEGDELSRQIEVRGDSGGSDSCLVDRELTAAPDVAGAPCPFHSYVV
jgi:hypothetical protein